MCLEMKEGYRGCRGLKDEHFLGKQLVSKRKAGY
jgi:hypothetical protein